MKLKQIVTSMAVYGSKDGFNAWVSDGIDSAQRYTGSGFIKELPGLTELVNGREIGVLTDADLVEFTDELEFTDEFEAAPRYAGSGRLLRPEAAG